VRLHGTSSTKGSIWFQSFPGYQPQPTDQRAQLAPWLTDCSRPILLQNSKMHSPQFLARVHRNRQIARSIVGRLIRRLLVACNKRACVPPRLKRNDAPEGLQFLEQVRKRSFSTESTLSRHSFSSKADVWKSARRAVTTGYKRGAHANARWHAIGARSDSDPYCAGGVGARSEPTGEAATVVRSRVVQ
jgi:hypothetical protein